MKNIEFYYDELMSCNNYDDAINFILTINTEFKDDKDIRCLIRWLNERHYECQILNEKERAYLSDMIRPFRGRVLSIQKKKEEIKPYEYLNITVKSYDEEIYCETVSLPLFEEDSMYTGMEIDKWYSLDKLRL